MMEYKLVVVGHGSVGRSALIFHLINTNFEGQYEPTEMDYAACHQKVVQIDQETCLLEVFEARGKGEWEEAEFRIYRERFISAGHGFLFVFSITCRNSFGDIPYLREQMLGIREGDHVLPMVLVGNKCDLEPERQVATSEAADLAESFGCKYLETSAKERMNVEACFFELVREIRKARAREENKGKHPKQQCFLC
jgi:GTPase KRas protein